jgi:hypothetical protein
MTFLPFLCVSHALPLSFWHLLKSTNYEAVHYAVFSSFPTALNFFVNIVLICFLPVAYSESKLFYEILNPFRHFDRTPLAGDRHIARPLPATGQQNTEKRQHTHMHAYHASSGIRTHDSCARAAQNHTSPRPRGHRDRRCFVAVITKHFNFDTFPKDLLAVILLRFFPAYCWWDVKYVLSFH